ncbi:uncharacterized protein LOC125047558 [Penaeus chinensis]|uniref:uncharacterized protein LOC125047558 n=1 Tax=Penaeus chinensis TaxID=139456 RepID=UPI001FB5FEA6|nr:uncharacterized protein LOC125047558 [Penaeus chinensis]
MTTTTRRWAWAAMFLAAAGVVCAAPSDVMQEDYLEIFKKWMTGDQDEELMDLEAVLKCSPNATSEEFGLCLPLAHCANTGGVPAGTCAKGFGVCCIAQRTCGESTSYTHTNFVNPGYYGSDTGSGACTLTVNHAHKNICQMRLDFLELELAQPDDDGNCNMDFLAVTGGAATVPSICGSMNSQIAKLNYGVCIKAGEGYCGIAWGRVAAFGTNSFTVSGSLPSTMPLLVGTAATSGTGAACTTDYVIIPGGVDNNQNSEDRFCGLGFPDSVTSTMKPFAMYVHTDADESTDVGNRGFGLQYRQITDCC